MKVLFVCKQNVGRSQMARAFYNRITQSQDAEAVGITVREEGQTILERKNTSRSKNFFLLDVMNDIGYDLSQERRYALSKGDITSYDHIVNMATPDQTPDWLSALPNYIHWNVKDPRGQSYEITAQVRDEILERVKKFITANAAK